MKLDLNNPLKVKLSDRGWDLLKDRYKEFPEYIPKADSEGFLEFPGWNLFNIFGPFMMVGEVSPFETIEIKGEVK